MDSKENATSCPVCQEIYTDPRSLACGHSFCLQCLKGVAGNKQTFPCPICRFDVDLRYTNVDQLPKNYVLCIVIEALDKNTTSMCLDHNKSLDLFCQRCGVVICSKCLTMQHKGHDFEDIELIYTEQNKQLVAFLESTNHLTSMTKAKSDVVKQSRISMEKNIDSISKTVENTFKKWNDALQEQHLTIDSYVYQEKDQKRKVCVDAERILAGLMTTLTGLETDINKLRSKDTAFVVQHYGSLKTRKEDIERKVLEDIETCFSPPDNLVIEVYAPWIEEAINNIQLIDMKQAQVRQIPQTIAEIQEENFNLKRELDNIYFTISEFANTIAGVEGSDVTLFPEKAKQFTALGLTTRSNSAKQNKQSERSLKLDKDLERVTSAWTDMKEKETRRLQIENQYLKLILDRIHRKINAGEATSNIELEAPKSLENDQSIKDLTTNIGKVEHKFNDLERELDNVYVTISELANMITGVEGSDVTPSPENAKQFITLGLITRSNSAKKNKQSERSLKLYKDLERVTSAWSDMKEKGTAEIKRLNYWIQYLDSVITNLYAHVVTGAEPALEGSDPPPESSLANKYQYIQDIHDKFTHLESENKKYAEVNFGLEEILVALDSFCSSKKETNDNVLGKGDQFASRCPSEYRRAKQIADKFKEMKRKLSSLEKSMKEKTKEYKEKFAKEEKIKAQVVASLSQTQQTLNEKSVTLKTLQATHKSLQSDHDKITREKSILEERSRTIQNSISCFRQEKFDMDRKYQHIIDTLNDEITRLRQAEDSLSNRLSKLAGDPFTHDNVNIADLSDDDRPTKLSETYSELYDNEWMDAFEELTENMKLSDEAASIFLLRILMNAFRKCKEITWDRYVSLKLVASTLDIKHEQLLSMMAEEKQNTTANKTEIARDGQQEEENKEADTDISEPPKANKSEVATTGQLEEENEEAETNTSEICMQSTSLTSTLSIDEEKSLKNIWRATSINLKHESLKLMCANLLTCLGKPEKQMPKTAKYITCCTELCWKMGVKEKPMHLDVNAEKQVGHEKRFDTDKFRAYTKTGKYVAYVVWPALLLHEGGAMLAKGIAQGCHERM